MNECSAVCASGVAALVAMLAACSGPNEGRFVGPVTPDGPGCLASRGVLVAQSGSFLFTPSEGVITLRGTVLDTGELHGAFRTEGPNHQPVVFRFDGTLEQRQVRGVLTQPGCRAKVALQPG